MKLKGDLTVPLGIEPPGDEADPAIREPQGSLDPYGLVEEPGGQCDVIVAAVYRRGVANLKGIGELLAFLEDLPDGNGDEVGRGEAVR